MHLVTLPLQMLRHHFFMRKEEKKKITFPKIKAGCRLC